MRRLLLVFVASLQVSIVGCDWFKPLPVQPAKPAGAAQPKRIVVELPPSSPQALKIVQAAIEAHGGKANFAKANIGRTTMRIDGEFEPGEKGQSVATDIYDLPHRIKRIAVGTSKDKPFESLFVIDGATGWAQKDGGQPVPLPMVARQQQSAFPANNLSALLAITAPELTLTLIEDAKVNGVPADCVRVQRGSGWGGDMYFDKETHLLLASKKEMTGPKPGRKQLVESRYLSYRAIDGLQVPMKVESFVDGEPSMTIEVAEIVFLKSIPDTEFAKPAVYQQQGRRGLPGNAPAPEGVERGPRQ